MLQLYSLLRYHVQCVSGFEISLGVSFSQIGQNGGILIPIIPFDQPRGLVLEHARPRSHGATLYKNWGFV